MKTYRSATVCEVVGIKPVTLRQWHLRGIYTPETEDIVEWADVAKAFGTKDAFTLRRAADQIEDEVRSGWRVYTEVDILRIEIMARMSRHGIAPERAGLIAKHCIGSSFRDPNIIYVTSDGQEIEPQPARPVPPGKDRFAILFELSDHYKGAANPEDAESWCVKRSLFCVYGIENLPAVVERASDDIFRPNFKPETFIVLNLSAIEREVQEKLKAVEAQ